MGTVGFIFAQVGIFCGWNPIAGWLVTVLIALNSVSDILFYDTF